ncbi:unnamed protein product [Vitrella brassicaformis CCMP3155]|uniref:SHSP domain-containing protein n=2 Tax=Vitrella brassicaformis TaxID=1169539 RepID=A0A0G4EJ58_VITBC|nr:unnamed protein product [Vitrella brassicaformis CCMP3155]|mmetsp:Transcript_23074/g.57030  ORF Transcript_23074/g.57030 Transcript_23074/m.57030 type:complete len:232 (+) Transcript_23074:102-797(+)|eukprot:CEL97046.1 unnamed protein product [Vitrella brassicaformis CCMP3155]
MSLTVQIASKSLLGALNNPAVLSSIASRLNGLAQCGQARYFRGDLRPFHHPRDVHHPLAMLGDEMSQLIKRFDKDIGGEFFSRVFSDPAITRLVPPKPMMGSVDVQETHKEYIVTVDCPGVKKGDVKVSITDEEGGKVLTISGERRWSRDVPETAEVEGKEAAKEVSEKAAKEEATYHLRERAVGTFERKLSLPGNANTEDPKASFEDGVLTITFAKTAPEQGKARKVEIH